MYYVTCTCNNYIYSYKTIVLIFWLKRHPLDVSLISVERLRINMRPAQEHVHLPPIEEQQNQSLPRTSWPMTSRILKSIAT